jgi:hypothetical protein
MTHNEQNDRLSTLRVQAIHTEENRLTKRLFQLERRVSEIEARVLDISEVLDVLLGVKEIEEEHEVSLCFCTCDEEDEF